MTRDKKFEAIEISICDTYIARRRSHNSDAFNFSERENSRVSFPRGGTTATSAQLALSSYFGRTNDCAGCNADDGNYRRRCGSWRNVTLANANLAFYRRPPSPVDILLGSVARMQPWRRCRRR